MDKSVSRNEEEQFYLLPSNEQDLGLTKKIQPTSNVCHDPNSQRRKCYKVLDNHLISKDDS